MIGTRDLKALLRAQDIIDRISTEGEVPVYGLGQAIDISRYKLETCLGRRRYLVEMLTESVAYALPGLNGVFSVELAEAGCFELGADLPVVTQISALEFAYEDRAIQVTHRSGVGFRTRVYPL